jgi:malonyl-CoA O-methyltransferase
VTDSDQPVQVLDPIAAYARWAASYPARAHNPLMRAEERALLSLLPADLRGRAVLDAGCGSGRYMLHALHRGATYVIGVDRSPEMLKRAQGELASAQAGQAPAAGTIAHFELLQARLEALPLRDAWADVTVCGLTLGHLPSLQGALAELRRVTRPDGRILCSDFHPLAHGRGDRREFSAAGKRYAVQHHPYRHEEWQRACAAIGWRIVRTLEPRLDPQDLRERNHPDPVAMADPVAIVIELAAAPADPVRR